MPRHITDWLKRLLKFGNIISLFAAIMEIGLFVSLLVKTIPFSIVIPSIVIILSLVLFIDIARRDELSKELTAERILRRHFPLVKAYLDILRVLDKKQIYDTKLSYAKVILTFEILGLNGRSTKRVVGQNLSSSNVTEVVFRASGDSMVHENESMHLFCTHNLSKNHAQPLSSRILLSLPNFKVFSAEMNPPIRKRGGAFDITLCAQWPYAFTSNHDYVFVPLLHYKRGVSEVQVNIVSRHPLCNCAVWGWDVKRHALEQLEDNVQVQKNSSKFLLKWIRKSPNIDMIYIITFERDISLW